METSSAGGDLKALRRLITQADLALSTIPNPHPSISSVRESLNAAVHLARELEGANPAATLGARGGSTTAKRGPEYYARIAGMRKKHGGGRPAKTD